MNSKIKKSQIKVFVIAVFLVLFIFGGVIFYASKKITPEEIRRLTITTLEQNFSGAVVSLGTIDYSLGTSIKFNIVDLKLKLKNRKNNDQLVDLKSASLKIPVWSIIMGSGSVDLIIENPIFNYYEFSKTSNNWTLAIGPKGEVKPVKSEQIVDVKSDKKSKDKDSGKIAIPSFLAKSKVNIKLHNIGINYSLVDGSKGNIEINRFVVKDLNLEGSTAFELATKISMQNIGGGELSFEALMIGQVDLKEYVEKQNLKTSIVLTVNDAQIPGLENKLPSTKVDLALNLKSNGDIVVNQSLKVSNMLSVKTSVKLQGSKIYVEDLAVQAVLKELVDLMGAKMAKQLAIIDLGDATFELGGSLFVERSGDIIPKLNFKVGPQINITPVSGMTVNTSLHGSVNNKKLDLEVNNKLMGGHVTVAVNTLLNFTSAKINPIVIDISSANIVMSKEFLRKTIYSQKSDSSSSEKENIPKAAGGKKLADTTKKQFVKAPVLPTISMKMKMNNINIGGEILSGSSTINVKDDEIGSNNFAFKFSKGMGTISFLTKLLNNNANNTKLDFNLNGLNLSALNPFLPPMLDGLSGDCSGKVNGTLHLNPDEGLPQYGFDVNVNMKDGELKGINLKEHISGAINSVKILKKYAGTAGGKDMKISDEFELLKLDGKFKHDHYLIKNFQFIGIKKSVDAKGSGNIYPLSKTKEGIVDLDAKVAAVTEVIPLRLKGYQFDLKPDYTYTIAKLGKSMAKDKFNKALKDEKLKEKVLDKVKDNKNLQKMFKKLF